ncbi:MAG: YkgB family protein [Pyrinomonadaceae bacterium]
MVTRAEHIENANADSLGLTLENVGGAVIRYGLVIILVAVGSLKFTAYEAEGIQGLVANSPLMSWTYSVFSVRTLAALLGVVEITLGVLIATRPFAPKVSAIGSIGAIIMFLITLSFLLTTPGVWQAGYGFPFPSVLPGQFLVKDIMLLGAAIWTAGEALRAYDMRLVPVRDVS